MTENKTLKVLPIQTNTHWENKEENKKLINKILLKTNVPENSLLIFPEMTLTGFTMDCKKFAEREDGGSFEYFSGLSAFYRCHIIAGIILTDGNKYFNSLVHFETTGRIAAIYNKMHLFSLAGEDNYYNSGNSTVTTSVNGIKTGLTICYDLRFPELYRKYSEEGAELIVNSANWPVQRVGQWSALLKARAIENQCIVAGVNRIGLDPNAEYNGQSALINPLGEAIYKSAESSIPSLIDVDISEVERVRNKLPFLKDRRFTISLTADKIT